MTYATTSSSLHAGAAAAASKIRKPERPPSNMNVLLLKCEIGKSRPPVYDLPGPEHFYGCESEKKKKADDRALAHSQLKHVEKPPVTDYIASNRSTAKEGVVTPRQTREYWEEHERPVKIRGNAGKFAALSAAVKAEEGMSSAAQKSSTIITLKSKARLPSDGNANHVYGKPTRPSTPVATLMSDKYAEEWLADRRARSEAQARLDREKQPHHPKMMIKMIHPKPGARGGKTTTTTTTRTRLEGGDGGLFKLSKFAKVGPKVVTTRTTTTTTTVPVPGARGRDGVEKVLVRREEVVVPSEAVAAV